MLSQVAERTTLRSSAGRLAQSLAVVALVACHHPPAAPDDAPLRSALSRLMNGDEVVARSAAAQLSTAGKPSLALVSDVLQNGATTSEQRARLIGVLAHMSEGGDAAPLLGQITLHDSDGLVRAEAEWTLKHWAAEHNDRADRAKHELRLIDAARERTAPG